MRHINKWCDPATESAIVTSMHLIPQWISRLLEDCEADNGDSWNIRLLAKEGRAAVWNMCLTLGVDFNGVPGQACRLLERFLAAKMRMSTNLSMGYEERITLKRSLMAKLPLLIVSCIQLAAKMSCADVQINAAIIRVCLACKGLLFTVNEINDSEFNVFSMLGFRVPLWTSVEAGEVLAVEVGLPQEMLQSVAMFVNLAEYYRDRLEHHVRWAANLVPTSTNYIKLRVSLRTLHLVAGAVVASARSMSFTGPDPAPRLATLTRAPLCYIRCVSDVILSTILVEDSDEGSNIRKRKIEQ